MFGLVTCQRNICLYFKRILQRPSFLNLKLFRFTGDTIVMISKRLPAMLTFCLVIILVDKVDAALQFRYDISGPGAVVKNGTKVIIPNQLFYVDVYGSNTDSHYGLSMTFAFTGTGAVTNVTWTDTSTWVDASFKALHTALQTTYAESWDGNLTNQIIPGEVGDLFNYTGISLDSVFRTDGLSHLLLHCGATLSAQSGTLCIDTGVPANSYYEWLFDDPQPTFANGLSKQCWAISPNLPPVLNAVGNKTIAEGSILNFNIAAADPNNDSLIFTAAPLPAHTAFTDNHNKNATFDFAPDYAQAGNYQVLFIVSDGQLADSELVTITVTNTNRPPVLAAIGSKTAAEGANLHFSTTAIDPDGGTLVFTAAPLPSNATYADNHNNSGTFDFNPNYTQAGTYQVLFIASDGTLADSEQVLITVTNVNRPPVLAAIGSKTAAEGANLHFSTAATDPDGGTLVFTAAPLPSNATYADNHNNSGTFDFNPSYTQAGTYQVLFIASDGALADSEQVAITVNNVNLAPVLAAIGSKSVAQSANLHFTVTATDADNDPVSLTAAPLPANAIFVDNLNRTGTFDFTPNTSQSGNYLVTFVASDGTMADTEIVTITVLRPPQVTSVFVENSYPAVNVINHTPVLSWKYSDPNGRAQTRFEVDFGTDNNWTISELWNPNPYSSSDTSVVYAGTSLSDAQTYYFRVRVYNGVLWSTYMGGSFRMNNVPTPTAALSPAAGQILNAAAPALIIQKSTDADGDTVFYDFEISQDSTHLIASVYNYFTTSNPVIWNVPISLAENNRYLWRARAGDKHEYSSWTGWSEFWVNTVADPPSVFDIVSVPLIGDKLFQMRPQLQWSRSSDPDPFDTVHYTLYLSADSTFLTGTTIANLHDTAFTMTDSLAFGTKYWWKVKAIDRAGLTRFSTTVQPFKTWRLGDADGSWKLNLRDIAYLISYSYKGGPAPNPRCAGDLNSDCSLNPQDILILINFIYKNGPALKVGCQ